MPGSSVWDISKYYRRQFTTYYRLNPYSQQAVSFLSRLDHEAMADLPSVEYTNQMTYILLTEALAAAQGPSFGLGDQLYEALQAGLIRTLLSFRAVQEEFPGLSCPSDLASLEDSFNRYRKRLLRDLDHWNDGELYHFAFQEFVDSILPEVRRRHAASYALVRARCESYKEELIAAAWHPTRVERWLQAGMELENL